ncbi:30S ribosomal protein S3, partial [Elusimicrobiota bacterium]
MGQKVSPRANRLGYIEDWTSRWFSPRGAPALIKEDFLIRKIVKERLKFAAVSKIIIERAGNLLRVILYTARPGMVIGRRGADIEALKAIVEGMTSKKTFISVMEVKVPEIEAQLVAESIALQLEKRIHHRRAMKRSIERAMGSGAGGIKIMLS